MKQTWNNFDEAMFNASWVVTALTARDFKQAVKLAEITMHHCRLLELEQIQREKEQAGEIT